MHVGRSLLNVFLAVAMGAGSAASFAVDNPDAPDRVAEFRARADPYENRIGEAAASASRTAVAYADYDRFLDSELNHAYASLLPRLPATAQADLKRSQLRWLAWRDSELRFIDRNWVESRFGTSAGLSRGGYRAEIVKQRVVELLNYLRNYPGP